MKTPAGTECRFYYQDYYRGRETQECRLLAENPKSDPWYPGLCHHCPVPRILQANACPNLILEGRVEKGFLGLGKRVVVTAGCREQLVDVPEPQVGCGHCHEHQPWLMMTEDKDKA